MTSGLEYLSEPPWPNARYAGPPVAYLRATSAIVSALAPQTPSAHSHVYGRWLRLRLSSTVMAFLPSTSNEPSSAAVATASAYGTAAPLAASHTMKSPGSTGSPVSSSVPQAAPVRSSLPVASSMRNGNDVCSRM